MVQPRHVEVLICCSEIGTVSARLVLNTLEFSSVQYNNNYNRDNVYGAIIMTKVIARVHPVHLNNVD